MTSPTDPKDPGSRPIAPIEACVISVLPNDSLLIELYVA